MKECVNCHKALRDDFKVCPYCGTLVDHTQKRRCEKCHAEITEKYAFCPRCGSPVNKSEKQTEAKKVTVTPKALPAEIRVAYCYGNSPARQLVEGVLCISKEGVQFKDLLGTSHDHFIDIDSIDKAFFTSKNVDAPKGFCYVLTLNDGRLRRYCFTCFQNQKLYEAHSELWAANNN